MTKKDDLFTKFVHLKQKGNINDYIYKWKVLATRQIGEKVHLWIEGLQSQQNKDARHAVKLIEHKNKVNRSSFIGQDQIGILLSNQENTLQIGRTSMYHPLEGG